MTVYSPPDFEAITYDLDHVPDQSEIHPDDPHTTWLGPLDAEIRLAGTRRRYKVGMLLGEESKDAIGISIWTITDTANENVAKHCQRNGQIDVTLGMLRFRATLIPTEVEPTLIESYRKTIFRVWNVHTRVEFKVNLENPMLDSLLEAKNARTAAFITAYNPGSEKSSPEDNDRAHKALLGDLKSDGFRWLNGDGVDPNDIWKPETSVLILALDKSKATSLAKKYGQNAYVWIERGDPPQLVLTR